VIDWWGFLHNALWVIGLAVVLAALSMTSYRAHEEGARLWQKLSEPGFLLPFNAGITLFCVGLLFSSQVWWEWVLWGVLLLAFGFQTVRLGWQNPVRLMASGTREAIGNVEDLAFEQKSSPLRKTVRALASAEIWLVSLFVVAGIVSARALPWTLVVAGVFWLVRWLAYGRPSIRTPADWSIVFLLLMIPVTLWATAQPETTRPLIYRLLVGVALYYTVVNWARTPARLRLLVVGVWVAGFFLALYGLVSVEWPTGKLPLVPSSVLNNLPSSISNTVNPNVMAGSLIVPLPVVLASWLFGWRDLNWPFRILAIVISLAMVGVLVVTQSRGAYLALAAVLGLLALLRWRRGWLLLLAFVVAVGIAVWLLGFSTVLDTLMYSGTLSGIDGRLEVWSRALYMIQDFPFTGIGMGLYGPVADLLYPFFLAGPGVIPHAHNLFLQVAVDLGIPGLIAWLSILMLVVAVAWRVYRRGRVAGDGWVAGLGAGLLGSQLALAVHGLTNAATWGEIRTAPITWGLWGLTMACGLLIAFRRSEDSGEIAPHEPELQSPQPPSAKRRGSQWLGCGLLLAGLLVLAGWALITGFQLLGHARSLQVHLQQLERLAEGGSSDVGLADLETVGKHLTGMRHDLEAIQAKTGPFLPATRLLSWLPTYGGDLAAAGDLLDLAVRVSAAGDRTFQALAPALELLPGSGGDADPALSVGERLLPVLVAAQPELQIARQELAAAAQARERLDANSLSPRVAGLLARLDRYLPWFETALDASALAPGLLGADGPRTYLIIAQNSQELRATGGFISGVGELTVEGGRLGSPQFSDSYAVDNFQMPQDLPPEDFRRVLQGGLLLFRDANWDPDFPTTAQRALDIYARNRDVQADGLVALDLAAVQLLVGAVGPLQVEGIDEPVTGANVLDIIQAQWGSSANKTEGDWWLHRKDFMGQIASAAMQQLMTGQNLQPAKLAQALKQALDEKHILLYLDDPQAAGLTRGRNWDGAVATPSTPSDQLLVVDSNVGFNKVDVNITRSIRYRVDLSDNEGPRAQLTLTYQNRGTQPVDDCTQKSNYGDTYADMIERCYWDYLRIYVPAGSKLLAGPGVPLPPGSMLAHMADPLPSPPISPTLSTGDREVWTTLFDLEPTGKRTLTFDYQLPGDVLEHGADGLMTYRLRVQKQPGTGATPLRVEIALPPGAELLEAMPAEMPVLSTDLRVDREFVIVWRMKGP